MGYSIYIPKWYNFDTFWTSPQFHLAQDSCDAVGFGPNVGFFLNDNHQYEISIGGDSKSCTTSSGLERRKTMATHALEVGQWNDIVINFKFNYDSSGFFKIWVNGVLSSDSGINASNDAKGPYLKMGIYAHPNETMTVYYDEIKVGDQSSSYSEVAPAGASRDSADTTVTLDPPVLKVVN